MKISVNESYNIVLEEVYDPIILDNGNRDLISICVRGGTFEIIVIPTNGNRTVNRVDLETGEIEKLN